MKSTQNRKVPLFAALSAVALLVACDADVEEPGRMPDVDVSTEGGQMPEYEVRQTQEGRLPDVDVDADAGKLPEVDVTGPDVDVERETVTVPDVDIEKEKVTVPTLDVDPAQEQAN